jgi:osomolarity two-component system sensor histidine kinase SLN1
MPLVSGMEMVAKLRSAGRHDFVVGLTGDASATDRDRFRQAGADEYVWIDSCVFILTLLPRVLPKPVLESSVKVTLQKAKERQASTDAPMIRVHQPP